MSDDEKFAALFAGQPGTVLGENVEPLTFDSSAAKAKRKAATEKRLPPLRPNKHRVPPGQERVDKWPILDLGHQPLVPKEQWELKIAGSIERALTLNWKQFQSLPQCVIDADIHCVTAWSLLDNRWHGVATRTLLDLVQPRASAKHVIFHSHDGYRSNLTLERFATNNALLATARNDKPLTREHGGPVRAVIPSLYFWKSAKWVRQITFLDQDVKGYWEALGYHNDGDPWKEQRYE